MRLNYCIIILADQLIKFLLLTFFPQFVIYNQGIAFGFLASNFTWIALHILLLFIVFFLMPESSGKKLIIGGGVSNLLDRIFQGGVVDYIDFKIWPVFNLADIFICIGIGLIVYRGIP